MARTALEVSVFNAAAVAGAVAPSAKMEQDQSPQDHPDGLDAAAKQLVQILLVPRRNLNTQRQTRHALLFVRTFRYANVL